MLAVKFAGGGRDISAAKSGASNPRRADPEGGGPTALQPWYAGAMTTDHWLLFLGGCLLPAAILSYLGGFVMRRVAPRLGLVDQPGARKVHTTPTPLGGGIAIAAGVLLPFVAGTIAVLVVRGSSGLEATLPGLVREHLDGIVGQLGRLWLILGSAATLAILGLIDDRRGLNWKLRLAVQFAAATLCVVCIPQLQLTAFLPIPGLTFALSIFWIVALVNAFNMLDNMDGLSAGIATIAATFLAAVLLLYPDPETARPQLFVAGLLLVLTGSLAGFLGHNLPPAKIFMGDAGSYFIGFLLACASLLATYTGYHGETPHAILAPLFVFAVPWYDLLSVVWIRIRGGRSPFEADKNHFSHRLVELGFSKPIAVRVIYLVTAVCGLAAVLLHRKDRLGACFLTLLLFCLFGIVALLESTARRTIRNRAK